MAEERRGILGVVGSEVADLLALLQDELAADGALSLFAEMGFQFPPAVGDAVRPALDSIISSASDLPNKVEAVNAATANGPLAVISAVKDLIDAIGLVKNGISQLIPALTTAAADNGVDAAAVAAFLNNFVFRLIEFLLFLEFEQRFPRVLRFLVLLGMAEVRVVTPPAPDPLHPPFVLRRLRFDRPQALVTDPEGVFADEYGWGTQTLKADLLLSRINDLLASFAVPSLFDPGTASRPPRLDAFVLSILSDPTLTPPGLSAELMLSLQNTFSVQFPFFLDNWNLEIDAKGPLDKGLSATLQPPHTLTLLPPSPPLTGNLALSIVGQRPAQSPSFDIFSIPGVGGIDARRARAQVGISYTAVPNQSTVSADPFVSLTLEDVQFRMTRDAADGFTQRLLPKSTQAPGVSVGIGWSPKRGVFFTGSGALQVTFPIGATIGPLTIDTLSLALRPDGSGIAADAAIAGSATIGPVSASVDGLGVTALVAFGSGNLGVGDLSAKFKTPTGVGIAVNGGAISGGGFLSFESGKYSGAIELEAYSISIKAFGLIETGAAGTGFSFVIVISTEFATPIQLGLGFTLNGVGGMIGINRTVNSDALRALVVAGRTENLLFPKNVIANAPAIIRDLGTVFPARAGHYVFGPLAKLGWGTPTLITAELALILELPGPVLSLIGEVKCLLPKPELALVKFNMSIAGQLDFPQKSFSLDAALHDSVIEGYPVSGQMAMRLRWGEQPNFALSIGGFHPAYQPPPNFPALQPMTVALAQTGSSTSVTVSGFFALTSNTLQIGGEARLHASGSGISLDASVSVKTIFIFSPFSFAANVDASVKISFHGYGPSVHLSGVLSGPSPWRAKGEVCVSIIWWDACLGFDQTFGGGTKVPEPVLDPWLGSATVQGLQGALQDAKNWAALPPPGSFTVVSRAPGANDLVDPWAASRCGRRRCLSRRRCRSRASVRRKLPSRRGTGPVRSSSTAGRGATEQTLR